MSVDVESYLGDAVLSGKVSSIGQLKYRMVETLKDAGQEDFVPVFCARYNFDVIPYDRDLEWDYRMDLDVCEVWNCQEKCSVKTPEKKNIVKRRYGGSVPGR